MTPICGVIVAPFAVEEMTKSMSPERTFWSMTGSWPSWAAGNWSTTIVPLLSSSSFFPKTSPEKPYPVLWGWS